MKVAQIVQNPANQSANPAARKAARMENNK